MNIALIGCGKMGSALLRGWLTAKIAKRIDVLDPAGLPEKFKGVTYYTDPAKLPPADIYVMAVKPQVMDDVCAALDIPGTALVLSIAAGRSIASFERSFGKRQPVIRAMPNTPAAIGKGISVATANKNVSAGQKKAAETLLKATGLVEWVDNEKLLDPVTAVSGSGPAYVFLLIETLAKAGEKAGLPKDLAMKLARQTVIGSATLAEQDTATPAAKLRENVTSPGGTTAAALEVLMDGKLQKLFDSAIAAATKRGKELSK